MKRKTVNIEKLGPDDISDEDLLEVSLTLIRKLLLRSDDDRDHMIRRNSPVEEEVYGDRSKRLTEVLLSLKGIPERPVKKRYWDVCS